jgi:hypothetical protein
MAMSRVWTLLVSALLVNAMLVGASWDQAIKQLPARRVIGVEALSAYSKAGRPTESGSRAPRRCAVWCSGAGRQHFKATVSSSPDGADHREGEAPVAVI